MPSDRLKPDILRKVVDLASRLEAEEKDNLTVDEIEAIGRAVGIEPVFIHRALRQIGKEPALSKKGLSYRMKKAISGAWWASGWTLPFILVLINLPLLSSGVGFFLGWGIYLAGGILLTEWAKMARSEEVAPGKMVSDFASTELVGEVVLGGTGTGRRGRSVLYSRTELLQVLFALRKSLEAQKERKAFLSVDVVGSSEMKRGAPELDAEYSFIRFLDWVEEVVRRFGGVIHNAAGDGVIALFEDDGAAVDAAISLQKEITQFNKVHNRLPTAFRIRCGVSAGVVPVDETLPMGKIVSPVIDRAAELRKLAEPGEVIIDGTVQSGALAHLSQIRPMVTPDGSPAFRWS